jgi:hypothetical protein
MSVNTVVNKEPPMIIRELMPWLQSHSDEEIIRLARSVPFTRKLDAYGMHTLALVLATRLERAMLADRQVP